MNFLGHFYLSGHDPELVVGNFIADFVKGKKYLDYPSKISEGIMMHRNIDDFTDRHPTFLQGKRRLFPKYRHYSGVIQDMYYDHFLASLWSDYSSEPLYDFSYRIYDYIENYKHLLPEKSMYMYPYMKGGNWLMRYQTIEGISESLHGMSRRISHDSKLDQATQELIENYDSIKEEFQAFMPELEKEFAGF